MVCSRSAGDDASTKIERREEGTMRSATYDLTSSFVQTIDADPDRVYEALVRTDPRRSIADRLTALGLDDRALWAESPATLGAAGWDDPKELGYSLVWRFDRDGRRATLTWRITVTEDAAGRTVLATRLAARGSDDEARRRVFASWPLVEELARGHARRLARSLEDYVNEDAYDAAPTVANAPRLRVVV
jgi:hypothetical protein